jgi:hypothetical protein
MAGAEISRAACGVRPAVGAAKRLSIRKPGAAMGKRSINGLTSLGPLRDEWRGDDPPSSNDTSINRIRER